MQEVPLTKGYTALVDDEDYPKVAEFAWYADDRASHGVYAKACTKGSYAARRRLQLHRLVLGLDDPSVFVDHINGDTLDCRKDNLRTATPGQNVANTRQRVGASGYRGVRLTPGGRYEAHAKLGRGKYTYIGTFDTPEGAALARDAAVSAVFGEFAILNFPQAAGGCSYS